MPRNPYAQVAELVDAQVSGTCGRKVVEVRVFSWAPRAGMGNAAPHNILFPAKPEQPPLMPIQLHHGDLPDSLAFTDSVAVDTETMGLIHHRDRLCLVQIGDGNGNCHLVRIPRAAPGAHRAPNLQRLLADPDIVKIFHYARFDLAALRHWLGAETAPVYCTKIASRLVRTSSDRHGLSDLTRGLLGVDMSKQQQSSDWAADKLSDAQLHYAAADVLHLHAIKAKLDLLLEREGRTELAAACCRFLPTRAALDLAGWADTDIFAHS